MTAPPSRVDDGRWHTAQPFIEPLRRKRAWHVYHARIVRFDGVEWHWETCRHKHEDREVALRCGQDMAKERNR